jgi:mono/diheme cytochrome c family protein/DNA-binding beta-propeller fold protein YncE
VAADLERESGPLVRLLVDGKPALALADEDARAIRLLDPVAGTLLATTALECAPHQLIATARGELFATLPRCNRVSRFELDPGSALTLREVHTRSLGAEPVALALGPDQRELFAVSAWGRTLSVLSMPELALARSVDLPRAPRAVSISEDGASAFISHASGGVLSEVPLAGGDVVEHGVSTFHAGRSLLRVARFREIDFDFFGPRSVMPLRHRRQLLARGVSSSLEGTQGFALAAREGRVFVPQVLSNPGESSLPSGGYGAVGSPLPPTLQDVAVFDTHTRTCNRAGSFAVIDGWHEKQKNVCRLPRAAVFDELRSTLLVACLGSGRVLELDAFARDPARTELRQWRLPAGPSGIALDPEQQRAYVWSRFARSVAVIDTEGGDTSLPEMSPEAVARRAKPTPEGSVLSDFALPALAEREQHLLLGNALFHTAFDARISRDGRACASCHPAGRDDGLSWRTGDELSARQTPMLDGRLTGTAPYGWLGQSATLEQHVTNTLANRLHGTGLEPAALAALVDYLGALPGPPVERAQTSEAVARGKALFHRADVGCADCHHDDGGVDGIQYELSGEGATDTPSLRFVAGGAPYFHDGRFATLDQLLEVTAGSMGQTLALSSVERSDLVAYLRTL